MNGKKYKYIYGPVPSWRLGYSLGIDPVSTREKVCSFDCVYCQIGKTCLLTDERRVFIKCKDIIEELNSLPSLTIDYITFAGAGEPTLAKNLGKIILAVKKVCKEKIAVISNASLFYRQDVRDDLMHADLVVAKLDAPTQDILKKISCPAEGINIENIISGIKSFKSAFKGKMALQCMFVAQNKESAPMIARLTREISPDEVQINTPLRPCKEKPLSEVELKEIESYFTGLHCVSVYKAEKKHIKAISDKDTLIRRGKI